MYPSTLSVHWPPIPTSVPFPTNSPSLSIYQPPSSPVPSIHTPSPLFSGLRPNTTLRRPSAPIFGEHHASDSEDEESIESNQSGLAMIPPCTDYSRYSYWLKKHFPHQMTKSNMNFVENILEIKDLNTALKFKAFQPKDWRVFLGKYLYQRYLKMIACVSHYLVSYSWTSSFYLLCWVLWHQSNTNVFGDVLFWLEMRHVISSGWYCRSSSIVITKSPLAWFIPQSSALCCPQFRKRFIPTILLGKSWQMLLISSQLLSLLPSFTSIISVSAPISAKRASILLHSSFMVSWLLKTGTTIE